MVEVVALPSALAVAVKELASQEKQLSAMELAVVVVEQVSVLRAVVEHLG